MKKEGSVARSVVGFSKSFSLDHWHTSFCIVITAADFAPSSQHQAVLGTSPY